MKISEKAVQKRPQIRGAVFEQNFYRILGTQCRQCDSSMLFSTRTSESNDAVAEKARPNEVELFNFVENNENIAGLKDQ